MLDLNQAPRHGFPSVPPTVLEQSNLSEMLSRFQDAIESEGYGRPDVETDTDRVMRFDLPDERTGKKSGWYIFHTDGIPAGSFGSWPDGSSISWCSKEESQMTAQERSAHQGYMLKMKAARKAERERLHRLGREKAVSMMVQFSPASQGNPYLSAKGVVPAGDLRADGETLVVPVLGSDGQAQSLQFIQPDGNKRFLSGGKIGGGYFPIPGGDYSIYICEGVATGLSIHQATGQTVICAFNAGNLPAVAKLARERLPGREIVIAGDNDRKTELKSGENPGRTSAENAAQSVDGKVVLPLFPESRTDLSDFNDLHQLEGLEAVRERLTLVGIPLGETKEQQGESFLSSLDLDACKISHMIENVPEPLEWTLKNSMLTQSVGLLVGPPGAGKSTFLIELATSVASGVPLFGEHLVPQMQGKVLAFFCEDKQERLHHRTHYIVHQLTRRMPNRPLDLGIIGENVYFKSCAGKEMRLVREVAGEAPSPSPIYDDLLALAKGIEGLAFIILDPYSRTSGVSENDNPLNTFVISLLERLAMETGASVLCVHHVGKRAGYTKKGFDLGEAMHPDVLRGATAITGAIRWQMNLFPLPAKEAKKEIGDQQAEWGTYLAGKVSKKNYGPPESVFFLKRERDGFLVPVQAAPKQEKTNTDRNLEVWVLKKVRKVNDDGERVTKYNMRSLSDEWKPIGGSRKRVEETIDRLLFNKKLSISIEKNDRNRMTEYLVLGDECEPDSIPARIPADPIPSTPAKQGRLACNAPE